MYWILCALKDVFCGSVRLYELFRVEGGLVRVEIV